MEVRNNTEYGEICRPGGFSLTEHALSLCSFKDGGRIIDMGCGSGASVAFFREHGFSASGIEINPEKVSLGKTLHRDIFCGNAAELPFLENSADGLFFECSFSKMEEPEKVLQEAFRVLKTEGKIVFTDFYAKKEPHKFRGLLGRVEPISTWQERILKCGFSQVYFEDCSDLLPQMWGQLIMDYGLTCLTEGLGAPMSELSATKCGYFLLIVKKGEMPCPQR